MAQKEGRRTSNNNIKIKSYESYSKFLHDFMGE